MLHVMPLNNNNFLKFTLIALSFSLSGLFACMLFSINNSTASAQQQQLQASNPAQNNTANASTVSLTGTAATMVKPDKVTVSLGLETTNKTANAALAANSKIMNKLIDALKASGVKDNETSTSSFSISPNYNYSQQQPSDITGRRITGFTASNTIQIQSTNINNTSKWIDTAIAAGANTIDGIDFALSNKKLEETKTNLIRQAMQDTRTKADILASAAGMKIVGVKSINLNDFATQPPFPPPIPSARQSLAAEEARPTPIISGQEDITTNVDVIFLVR
jgi:uncharacterized protein YggE